MTQPDGSVPWRSSPVRAGDLTGVVEIVAGEFFRCARRNDGQVFCWGHDAEGRLGDGEPGLDQHWPVAVIGLTDAVEISAGGFSVCARRTSGRISCWGNNAMGQLGDGTTTARPSPV